MTLPGCWARPSACRIVFAVALVFTLATCGSPSTPPSADPPPSGGVIVEAVRAGGAADRAGIEVGDHILGWRRGDVHGTIDSAFDLDRVEIVEAQQPKSPVSLDVWRPRGTRQVVSLPPARWRLRVRTAWVDSGRVRFEQGRDALDAGDLDTTASAWRSLAANATTPARQVSVLDRLAAALIQAGDTQGADDTFADALDAVETNPELTAWLQERRARQASPTEATDAFHAASHDPSTHAERALPDAWHARLLLARAENAYRRGQADEVVRLGTNALARWRGVAPEQPVPGGAEALRTGILLAKAQRNQGKLQDASDTLTRLAVETTSLDPGSRLHADILSEHGLVAETRGDLATAETKQQLAMTMMRGLGVKDTTFGRMLMGVGIVAWRRGNLATAEARFREARSIFEAHAAGTPFESWSRTGLGNVALQRGDVDTATAHFERALAILEARGSDTAVTLGSLSGAAEARGDHDAALDYLNAALVVARSRWPGSVVEARLLARLGALAGRAGDVTTARQHLDQGVAWYTRNADGGVEHANALLQRGTLALDQARFEDAKTDLTRAVAIRDRLTPASTGQADALFALARLYRAQDRPREALDLLERAVEAVAEQGLRLGGTPDALSTFRAQFAPLFRALVRAQLEARDTPAAFGTLEQYRARGLLALLAARDLALDEVLPPALAQRRRDNAHAYETAQAEVDALDPKADPGETQRLLDTLATLRQNRKTLEAEVLIAAPRLAALEAPVPLDLENAAATLAPGTVLLSFMLDADGGTVFVLDAGAPGSVEAVPLSVGEPELRREVAAFRYLLRSPSTHAAQAGLRRRARQLHRWLVAPVEHRVKGAERLLIVPDGPLHGLPFAALDASHGSQPPRYLLHQAPLHTAASVTLFATLTRDPPAASNRPRVAFGDPTYRPRDRASDTGGDTDAGHPLGRRRGLAPLPATRAEVQAVRNALPDTVTYLGTEATEDRLKQLRGPLRLLHLACHGAVDTRFPLDSYLALSTTDDERRDLPHKKTPPENGILQAWEIFEQLRLDTDLVTLSACETGLGGERGGEGLIGLTRAFQYAGARSIVASLWRVADRSTAALMGRFYDYLGAGLSTDQALRRAQLDLIGGDVTLLPTPPTGLEKALGWLRAPFRSRASRLTLDARHPYHWASFQLIGDWR